MSNQTRAPHFSENRAGKRYPNDGASLGPAWQGLWDALTAAGSDYLDGNELSARVAAEHGLATLTVRNLLTIAKRLGMLDVEQRRVTLTVRRGAGMVEAPYSRSFYRIAQGQRVQA